ncbi:hypothetical protein JMM61_11380 [Rhodovulum sulfidophilum]|uniref:hypothetical protein n=1 Tax=Rhodovulum sulfidophilum TaxID=35806 RepID=UPI001926099A|nr:hypothetical protein [Rhodovulum sulfidophilum]MBL3585978.1 hypothetical protein [Rhodovulum sulfidophilum]
MQDAAATRIEAARPATCHPEAIAEPLPEHQAALPHPVLGDGLDGVVSMIEGRSRPLGDTGRIGCASAARLCDGRIVEAVGDPDLTHRLTGFTTLGLDALASTASAGPKTACAILRAPPPVDLLLVRVARGTELAAIVAACRPGVPLDRSGAPD